MLEQKGHLVLLFERLFLDQIDHSIFFSSIFSISKMNSVSSAAGAGATAGPPRCMHNHSSCLGAAGPEVYLSCFSLEIFVFVFVIVSLR